MEALRIETTIPEDGKVDLSAVPVGPDERVEIIVLYKRPETKRRTKESMRGSVLKYDRPFDPIVEDDEFNAWRDPDSVLDPNREIS